MKPLFFAEIEDFYQPELFELDMPDGSIEMVPWESLPTIVREYYNNLLEEVN